MELVASCPLADVAVAVVAFQLEHMGNHLERRLDLVCTPTKQIFPFPVVIFLAQRAEASKDLGHTAHLFYLTTDLVGE